MHFFKKTLIKDKINDKELKSLEEILQPFGRF